MEKLMRGITAICGMGILVLGSCLDSPDHFGAIFGGLLFCILECILYGMYVQRRE